MVFLSGVERHWKACQNILFSDEELNEMVSTP